jgi:tRNA/tmRNA/rRNA uracil-C5-methylase (TrmA/RlmC/RlmD family)
MQELTINAIGAQGDGLARTGDGKPAFVPLTLPGETGHWPRWTGARRDSSKS